MPHLFSPASEMAKRNDTAIAVAVLQSKLSAIKGSGISVDTLADKLLEKSIISDYEYRRVKDRSTGETTDNRRGNLIDLIIASIKQDDEAFQILIDILRGENTRRFDILAKSLEDAYDGK